jgi:hypothetical protein
MFKVDVDNLDAYFKFDSQRKRDLDGLDSLINKAAPKLKRYFHAGTPAGQPGMRFKMIGYGPYYYASRTGVRVLWPAIGVALQKNYVSAYIAVQKNGRPIIDFYAGSLGELRTGNCNFSFDSFDKLNTQALTAMLAEIQDLFLQPDGIPGRIMA